VGWKDNVVDILKTMVMGTKGRRRAIEEADDAATGKPQEAPEPEMMKDGPEKDEGPKPSTAMGFKKRMRG